jgi:hypothetical protein
MPDTNVTPQKSKLCRIIKENLPSATVVAGPRKYFREDLGVDYIDQVRRRHVRVNTAYIGGGSGKCESCNFCQVHSHLQS